MVGAIIGGLTGVASAAYSFYQADQEAKAASAAAAERAKLRTKRDKILEVNYFEGLTYPMEAFDMAFENTLAQTQTLTEALQEADPRALAAGIGRVGALATEQTTKTRQDLADIAQKVDFTERQAKDAIKQQTLSANVADQSEQMQMQRDAERMQASLINQGSEGLIMAGTAVGDEIDLYLKGPEDRKKSKDKKDSSEKKKKKKKNTEEDERPDSRRFVPENNMSYVPLEQDADGHNAYMQSLLQAQQLIQNPFITPKVY